MGWNVYDKKVNGVRLQGDQTMPPTRWWNHLFLLWFRWSLWSVCEVPEGAGPYQIGYVPFQGPARLRSEPINTRRFAVRHGREDCTFFVLACNDGRELPINIITRSSVKNILGVTYV
jgi:hypothetical protein